MGVIKNKFGINSELIFYYDYRGFQCVNEKTGFGCI